MIIEPVWVNTGELASSVMPDGELSNTVCDIGISVLQDTFPPNKVIFPYLVTKYLMEGFKLTLCGGLSEEITSISLATKIWYVIVSFSFIFVGR
jgi:hypothetical protein